MIYLLFSWFALVAVINTHNFYEQYSYKQWSLHNCIATRNTAKVTDEAGVMKQLSKEIE